MLEIDVAGLATAGGGKVEIDKLPDGVEFAALPEDHERLGTLVGADDKFTAHNAASWQSGLLVRVPEGRGARRSALRPRRGRRHRRDLLAAARRGRGRQPLLADRGVHLAVGGGCRLHERAVELFVEQGAKLEYVSLQNLVAGDLELRHASRHSREGRRARLGRRRLRLPARQGPHPQRPRRPGGDVARHRRVLRRRHAAPRLRHLPAAPRARRRPPTSPSRACSARRRASCGEG